MLSTDATPSPPPADAPHELDYDEAGNPVPRFTAARRGLHWIPITEVPSSRKREVCVSYAARTHIFTLLKREGRVSETTLLDTLSMPYVSVVRLLCAVDGVDGNVIAGSLNLELIMVDLTVNFHDNPRAPRWAELHSR